MEEITNELLPSLVVDHPTGFAPLDACVAAVRFRGVGGMDVLMVRRS